MSLSRRDFLYASTAMVGTALVGCSPKDPTTASFIQPWRSHLEWSGAQWLQRLTAMRELGCQEVFLQWVGIDNPDPAKTWSLSNDQIHNILDACAQTEMGIHLGIPYDETWWSLIAQTDASAVQQGLQRIAQRGTAYMQSASWNQHAAFRGWYLPYEIEQYHWADTQRIEWLSAMLLPMAQSAFQSAAHAATISTYFSLLPTQGQLTSLWQQLLDHVPLHPMLQDGVGVNGMRNFDALAPLQAMLHERQTPFDLVIELFEQTSAHEASTEFTARAATFSRIRKQWQKAQDYGAQRVVAFALDPWVLGDTAEAKLLYEQWRSMLQRQRSQ